MRIGFDFDHVLFDTEKFKKHLFRNIGEFDSTYEDAVDENGVYRPKKHAEILEIPYEKFEHAMEYADQCLYPDVNKLAEIPGSMTPVIVSRGDPSFQTRKIRESGVMRHFDDFFIVEKSAKDEGTGIDFLVDDAPIELERVSLPEDRVFKFSRTEHSLEDVLRRLTQIDGKK